MDSTGQSRLGTPSEAGSPTGPSIGGSSAVSRRESPNPRWTSAALILSLGTSCFVPHRSAASRSPVSGTNRFSRFWADRVWESSKCLTSFATARPGEQAHHASDSRIHPARPSIALDPAWPLTAVEGDHRNGGGPDEELLIEPRPVRSQEVGVRWTSQLDWTVCNTPRGIGSAVIARIGPQAAMTLAL